MAQPKVFEASAEAKGAATQLRLFAILAWIVAIGGEVFAILKLIHNETLKWLIVALVGILILSLVGSYLWKKANRLDPASEKDQPRFFIQNQLGAIMGVLAFLPLVILVFTNKDLDGKSKGIAGAVGVVALLIAGIYGIDFNPPSIEKYTQQMNEQTDSVKVLTGGTDLVYWAKEGNKYHLYQDCQYIKGHEGVSQGTVKQAFVARKIGDNELCSVCKRRAMKENNITPDQLDNATKTQSTAPADSAK